jgi:RND family efflux transporter MFP subunit
MKRKHAFQALAAILIVAAGIGIGIMLARSRKSPPRTERPYAGPLVEAEIANREDHQVTVSGFGTVRSSVSAQLIPQVSGVITDAHPRMVTGGYFSAGEMLVQVDPADYELAVQRAEAAVSRAEVELQMREAESAVARREWDRMNPGEDPPSQLVILQPQVERARTELAAAKAELASAQLNLDRTRLSLPWNGRVVSESIDLGQFAPVGQPLAQVYGTDVLEIPVPLQDAELGWFDIPDNSSETGAPHRIIAEFAGGRHHWTGHVSRTEGTIDPATRMVTVVVQVLSAEQPGDQPDLVPGMFVSLEIEGRVLKDVISLPLSALRGGENVWVERQGQLEIQPVSVLHKEGDRFFIAAGIEEGEAVVTSQLDVVTPGMKIRIGGGDAAQEAPQAGTSAGEVME